MNENPNAHEPQEKPRRRWLKRGALGILAAGLAGGIGYKAFAHRSGAMQGSFDPAQLDARLERMLKHLFVEIDATEAQKEQLAPIVKQAANDLLPLRDKMRAARQQAIELLTQESVDRGAIERLRAEQLALADQGSKRLAQALADAAEILTPEQRKALAERMQHRHRRWH